MSKSERWKGQQEEHAELGEWHVHRVPAVDTGMCLLEPLRKRVFCPAMKRHFPEIRPSLEHVPAD